MISMPITMTARARENRMNNSIMALGVNVSEIVLSY